MQTDPQIWYVVTDATPTSDLQLVYNLNYTHILLPWANRELVRKAPPPRHMRFAVLVSSTEEAKACLTDEAMRDRLDVLVADTPQTFGKVAKAARAAEVAAGLALTVDDSDSLDQAVKLAPRADVLLLELTDPTNIPLELVLATTQELDVRVGKRVRTATDGATSAMTLEMGADLLLLDSSDTQEIMALDNAFAASQTEKLELVKAVVTGIAHVGMGDRVCIDTTSELRQDEGMLLGSTSSGGIFTCSETHDLPYMDIRPFRVNAGALHLYVWGPCNKTYYLSDLRAGQEILAVSTSGEARPVTIGRLKIERRPMLQVEAEIDGTPVNTFIQDDWHVRLMSADGKILPSSEIRPGDALLAYADTPGRHVGIKIDETVKER